MLSVEQIGFAYSPADPQIFADVSFRVDAGKTLCILGPNGIGKTTLLKCVAGLAVPSRGTIRLEGREMSRMKRRDVARILAYVPQFHQPVFAYSVFDIVLMGRAPHIGFMGSPSGTDAAIARESLEAMGIDHLADKAYTEISGGERQMVMFARVMAQRPKILLLDEPTAHLDFGNQIQVLSLVKQMAATGLVVMMTSHAPDHAFMTAETVALMTKDDIRIGAPETILTEQRLKTAYGVDIRILDHGHGGKTCIPLMPETDTGDLNKEGE